MGLSDYDDYKYGAGPQGEASPLLKTRSDEINPFENSSEEEALPLQTGESHVPGIELAIHLKRPLPSAPQATTTVIGTAGKVNESVSSLSEIAHVPSVIERLKITLNNYKIKVSVLLDVN